MLAGSFFWHLFRAMKRSFGRLVLMFIVTALIAAVLVELAGIYLSGGQLPTQYTHLIAVILGLTVGYAITATMLVVEIIHDLFMTVDEMEHDFVSKFESGAHLMEGLVDGGAATLFDGAAHRVFDRS